MSGLSDVMHRYTLKAERRRKAWLHRFSIQAGGNPQLLTGRPFTFQVDIFIKFYTTPMKDFPKYQREKLWTHTTISFWGQCIKLCGIVTLLSVSFYVLEKFKHFGFLVLGRSQKRLWSGKLSLALKGKVKQHIKGKRDMLKKTTSPLMFS